MGPTLDQPCRRPVQGQTMLTVLTQNPPFVARNPDERSIRFQSASQQAEFHLAEPAILGVNGTLLTRYEFSSTRSAPRRADLALWATACENVLWYFYQRRRGQPQSRNRGHD